jgi:hypothetical protein
LSRKQKENIMKKKKGLKLFGIVTLALALSMTASLAWANGAQVLPSNSNPYGMNYGQWGAEWWQWVSQGTATNHPLLDTDGTFYNNPATNNEPSGDVFFLGGSWVGPVTRNVEVSADKALFFPIFNWVLSYPEDVPAANSHTMQAAENFMSKTLNNAIKIGDGYIHKEEELVVTVDDVNVIDYSHGLKQFYDNYRGTSEPFNLVFTDNCYEVTNDASGITGLPYQPGDHYPSISDGYWVMLAPLKPGTYEIKIQAGPEGSLFQDVTYKLTVDPLSTITPAQPLTASPNTLNFSRTGSNASTSHGYGDVALAANSYGWAYNFAGALGILRFDDRMYAEPLPLANDPYKRWQNYDF